MTNEHSPLAFNKKFRRDDGSGALIFFALGSHAAKQWEILSSSIAPTIRQIYLEQEIPCYPFDEIDEAPIAGIHYSFEHLPSENEPEDELPYFGNVLK
ncbi:hypothetical protein V5O48_012145 [Marasmius crinis-equi]|uniref:Uncharacterized protein n=1 Tax=Marasmius crinis-equi TaxID=585013 RepID=A0ABR3F3K2_9AGAR